MRLSYLSSSEDVHARFSFQALLFLQPCCFFPVTVSPVEGKLKKKRSYKGRCLVELPSPGCWLEFVCLLVAGSVSTWPSKHPSSPCCLLGDRPTQSGVWTLRSWHSEGLLSHGKAGQGQVSHRNHALDTSMQSAPVYPFVCAYGAECFVWIQVRPSSPIKRFPNSCFSPFSFCVAIFHKSNLSCGLVRENVAVFTFGQWVLRLKNAFVSLWSTTFSACPVSIRL